MADAIAFTALNVAGPADAADMPHVLGDPADTGWKGTAERINDNFAAINTYAALQPASTHATSASGAAVITPASGWTTVSAWGSTITLLAGVPFVHLTVALQYTGASSWLSDAGGSFSEAPSGITMGTVTPAFASPVLLRMQADYDLFSGQRRMAEVVFGKVNQNVILNRVSMTNVQFANKVIVRFTVAYPMNHNSWVSP